MNFKSIFLSYEMKLFLLSPVTILNKLPNNTYTLFNNYLEIISIETITSLNFLHLLSGLQNTKHI